MKNSDRITYRSGRLSVKRVVTNPPRAVVNVVETRNELAPRLFRDRQPPEKHQNVEPGLDVPPSASQR